MSMEIPINQLPPGDPRLVDAIVGQLKSKGIFDKFRKECLADVDTKPAFLNLRQRVDGQVKKFLSTKTWKSDLNKNQLRDGVRKNIQESGILDSGIDAIINQVVNPKIQPLILPLVEDTVYSFLQIEKPRRDIQEYDIHVQPVNVHHEEKNSFYGQPMSMPQPCPPYHPVYQEFPPDFHGGSDEHIVLPKATEIENDSINVEDSSISSESEISVEDKTEGEPKPPVQAQPSLTDIPMETDVISSGEDDILARASPDSSTSIQEKKVSQEAIKMEEDNAVDSFDSARKEADAMTAAVESLTLRDEKLKTNSETHETPKDTSVSLPLFDNKSLDSISSNTSGLSLSPTSHSKLTVTKDSESHLKDESQDNSPDEMRSAQSTPVVDEKSLNESISSENSKSWIPYQLPKDMPSAERITIASFGPFGSGESARVVEGASPVSVDDSQGSVEREDLQTTESKIAKVEKSEGEITSSSISSKSLPSPEYNKDATGISASDKDDTKSKIESIQESRHEETKEKERSKSKEKHSKERRRSKERERRRSKSKSKYDDHYSHHDKDKRHKRDKDDDRDKDRHSKGHHSGGAGRTPSSGDGGSKEKEKSKDHKSHSSSHSKSHTSSHSKSHSSSHSKSSTSSHSKTHSSSVSKEEKDNKSSQKSDKKEGSQEKSDKKEGSQEKSDKSSQKSDKKEGSHRESKHATVSQDEKFKDSVDAKQKERKNETKQKPVKLMEDNIFALHLGNSNKDAVLPKPVNSLTKKPVTPKPNVNSSKGGVCEPSTKCEKVKEGKEIKDNKNSDKEDSKNYKDSKNSDKDDSKDNDNSSQPTVNDSVKTTDSKITKRKNTNDKSRERDVNALTTIDNKIDTMENDNDEDNEKDINANHTILNNKTDKKETTEKIHEKICEDVSPKSVNGLIKTPLGKRRKMPKRKSLDLNVGASTSDSDSGESVEKMKSRGQSVKKTVDLISDFLSEKSLSRNEVTKVSSLETLSNAIKRIPLKRVTIPLVSIRDIEHEAATRSEKEILPVSSSSISEVDNLFNELFGNSSDESETEFEGFHSFANGKSTPARKMIKNVQRSSTIKKNVRRKNPTPIKKPYTKPKMSLKKPYLKPKMPKSMEYVVLCDSDSSDMEVGIVDLSLGAYSEDPKPNDFEGFDDEGSDESSNTADKKLRDYLSRFSFGNAMQIGDFISVESDDEEFVGEESTVFFNKKNTTRSVIEEIAAKQKLSPVQNASEEEETDEGKAPVVESITPAVNMESYKPFKKRKLSSLAEDIYSSPCKVLKTRPDAVQQSLAEEPVHKDLGLHTYSMLTPEEDRTSSREYEVDLGHRENSYSPLSPSSDSSSDAHLKHRNKAKVGEYRQSCTSPEVPS